jgi:hypothetical protein
VYKTAHQPPSWAMKKVSAAAVLIGRFSINEAMVVMYGGIYM